MDRGRTAPLSLPFGKTGRRRRDRALEVGSSAHYDDAAYYTRAYEKRTEDVAFWVALAQGVRGPVLEYGVGNGRIALPLARAGASVVGVDLSKPMLDDLRASLAAEPAEVRERVRARRGDMRSLRLGEQFPLVTCTFNTLLHLYERRDFERFFARVREHLAPGGRFVFDVSTPQPSELARDPERMFRWPRMRHPTRGDIVKYGERFDYDRVQQTLFVTMLFVPEASPADAWVTPLAHRQLFPRETEALLHYNGLKVERVYGDYARGPFDSSSDVAIWVCKAR